MSATDTARGVDPRAWLGADALGWALAIGAAASLVSARLAPFALLIALLAAVIAAGRSARMQALVPSLDTSALALSAFLAWAWLSVLWAEKGGKAVSKLLLVTIIVAGTVAVVRFVHSLPTSSARRAATGLAFGFGVGMAFLLTELLTGQAIQIAVYNVLDLPRDWMQPERHFRWVDDTLVSIVPVHINRNLAVAALLAFPVALAVRWIVPAASAAAVAVAAILAALLAASLSRHESSQVALVAASIVLVIALWSAPVARRLLQAGWVFACLAVVPLVLLTYRMDVHKIPGFHHSLAHRIIIWNTTAEEAMKSPVLGIGAYMTYVLMPERNKDAETEEGMRFKKTFSRHAHNVYLQTWFELGAVGAALLAVAGLAILGALRRVGPAAEPYALATFAAAATMMSSSYGMWQSWYLALFGFAAVALAVAARASGVQDGAAE